MELLEEHRCFEGRQQRWRHDSATLNCAMTFSIFLPPAAADAPPPVLYWLSGLTCNDENFTTKAGAQRVAAELGIALVMPDTSPRGDNVADDSAYDLGKGAPFRNYYKKAEKQKGMTGENLMITLELRLDNVIFRLGFARTRKEARQIVDHKHVLVNGKCVNIPSYLVKAGDVIEIREKSKSCARYKEVLEATNGRLVPEWLESDKEALKGTVKSLPTREAIDVPVNEMLIVELYSK